MGFVKLKNRLTLVAKEDSPMPLKRSILLKMTSLPQPWLFR
ncbi:unknown [Crocosphaera subtropica ATCC 51142]|uniref:Uncharacterized protein n=1 Tax=Crocosphaera subtropica (strain ATCC 51142 / BH68) TaxID=43989 RepID=B1WSM1_CROS5|nr:unknown [Crocosphaera subtropica ATCC 51142]